MFSKLISTPFKLDDDGSYVYIGGRLNSAIHLKGSSQHASGKADSGRSFSTTFPKGTLTHRDVECVETTGIAAKSVCIGQISIDVNDFQYWETLAPFTMLLSCMLNVCLISRSFVIQENECAFFFSFLFFVLRFPCNDINNYIPFPCFI